VGKQKTVIIFRRPSNGSQPPIGQEDWIRRNRRAPHGAFSAVFRMLDPNATLDATLAKAA
jgi:hypothetical protein